MTSNPSPMADVLQGQGLVHYQRAICVFLITLSFLQAVTERELSRGGTRERKLKRKKMFECGN